LSTAGVLILKGYLPVISRYYSTVGDSYAVNVACEIIEDYTSALDSWFTVDDPFFLSYGFRQFNILKLLTDTVNESAAKQS
jgi:hypothetical protein